MPRPEPFGLISQTSISGSGNDDGLEFIWCVGGRQPEIHEVLTFGDDGIMPEVHLTEIVDVGTFVGDYFATNYLTENGRRVPMFGRKLINGIFEWMGVPEFMRTNGTPWTANILVPYSDWGHGGPSTSQNLSSGSGKYSDSVHINWNRSASNLPISHRRVFENMRSAGSRAHDDILLEKRTYRIQIPSTCKKPICGRLVNRTDDTLDDRWDFSVCQ